MQLKVFHRSIIALLILLVCSCDPTKKLAPHQYIVDKVEVVNAKSTGIPEEDFQAFYRQKPNRKLFRKFHFFVWWYNLFDEDKLKANKVKRNLRFDRKNEKKTRKAERKNEKRAKKGKPPKAPRLKNKEDPTLLESIRDIGEPAVIYDSTLTDQTRQQLNRFLFTKGFFNNVVTDSVELKRNNQRAILKYHLFPNQGYTISSIAYDLPDKKLGDLIMADINNSLVKTGSQYDREILVRERQRITDLALNNGYYYFESAYIDFNADTTFATKKVDLTMRLKLYQPPDAQGDSLTFTEHPQYKIQNVYVITEGVTGNVRNAYFKDTTVSTRRKLKFLSNAPLAYRRRVITANTDIYPGQYYRKDTALQTYKALAQLNLFRNVSVQFFKNDNYYNTLDCYIVCNPLIKQSLTFETEGTNTTGNLGIDGSVVYLNRNFFRGGELVELRMQGSIVAQRQFNTADTLELDKLGSTFNTVMFGPELRFSVPRALFPFTLFSFRKDHQPRTTVKTVLNYQIRPEFKRVITSLDYGFSFRTMNRQLKHDISPLEIYFVRANLDPGFKEDLIEKEDAFLLNSFQDHVTTQSKYSITFTSKENALTGKRTAYYVKLNVQSSGNILRGVYVLTDQEQHKDTLGRYLLFGMPFAHFLKSDIDFRVYVPVRKKSRVVYRLAAGVGKPLKNLDVLPYEQSFFSGGPNSIRAWRARTLGPGGYNPAEDNNTRYDKIGDILLEGNFEYRFHVIRSFYGALFVDAGNIWRLHPDPAKPNGEFKLSTFADQIAIGAGAGIRWDFTFFVLRLDMGIPLKDPKFPAGQRWVLDQQPYEFAVFNFGIGYPF